MESSLALGSYCLQTFRINYFHNEIFNFIIFVHTTSFADNCANITVSVLTIQIFCIKMLKNELLNVRSWTVTVTRYYCKFVQKIVFCRMQTTQLCTRNDWIYPFGKRVCRFEVFLDHSGILYLFYRSESTGSKFIKNILNLNGRVILNLARAIYVAFS